MTIRRVLMVNYEYPPVGGGGGNATYHIARAMAALGVEPFVLTAAHGKLPRVEFTDGVTVRRIAALRQRADRCSIPEMLAYVAAASMAGPGLIRAWRPDISVAFHAIPSGIPSWFLKHASGLPYAISLQGGDVPGFDPGRLATWHRITAGGIRQLWSDAGAVVANSAGLAALARRHAPRQTIGMIPAGADVVGITSKTDYATPDLLTLLFVGRLVTQKGLDILIPALAKLPRDMKWRLLLVGDGPERASLLDLAARLDIAAHVETRGWVEKRALSDIYRTADIFVLPSRDEGMPNALLEAMAAGLPVIGTHVAGTVETAIEGETGLLVPSEDSDALTRAIVRLAGDADMRAAMGRAGRKRVEMHFSWQAVAGAWLDVLTEVRARKDARR